MPGTNILGATRGFIPNVIRTEVSFKDIYEHGLIQAEEAATSRRPSRRKNGMIEEYMSNPSIGDKIIVIGGLTAIIITYGRQTGGSGETV